MKCTKRNFKSGATSFYVVAISTLILVILATSFATAITAEIIRSANDDLAQSAYDSALAGIEEAKLAYANYQNCIYDGSIKEAEDMESLKDGKVSCPEIIYWMNHPDCDMVARILGHIKDTDGGREIDLEETSSGATNENLDQAYTCAMIDVTPRNVYGALGVSNPYKIINANNNHSSDIDSVILSWHVNAPDQQIAYANILENKKVIFPRTTIGSFSSPAIVALQIVQTSSEGFTFEQLNSASLYSASNRATMYFVPTGESELANSSAVTSSGTNFIGIYDGEKNIISASEVAKTNAHKKNYPYVVYCNTEALGDFACSVQIDLPKPINGEERASNTLSFILSLPYAGSTTQFSLSYNCQDATCDFEQDNTSDGVTSIKQIVIDSTGRANDMYKRIEVRLDAEPSAQVDGFPFYAIQSDTIKKNFSVDTEWGAEIQGEHNLYIDLAGGTGVQSPISCISQGEGCSVTIPTNKPTRRNYVFIGYATSASSTDISYQAGDEYTFAPEVTSATIYAVWEKAKYTIEYYGNGGTTSSGATKTSEDVEVDTTITLTPNPFSRSGYVFQGWAKSPTGPVVYADKASVKNIGTPNVPAKLYAVWGTQYEVAFNLNGGSGTTPASQTVLSGNSIRLPSSSGFSRTNYYFDGWRLNDPTSGTIYNSGSNYTVTSNVTFYANWVRETYQIIFNGNGGARNDGVTQTIQTANRGDNVTLADNPFVRSGYTFQGWATSPTGSVVYADKASVKNIGTMTSPANLYAIWKNPTQYIQDLTLDQCKKNVGINGNAANIGDNIIVYDKRDGNDYTVRYINGYCWMTQNLRITGTIKAEDSNFTGYDMLFYWRLDSGSTTTGVWYNYQAATANTISGTSNASVATKDICPAGWHLPSVLEAYSLGFSNVGKKPDAYINAFDMVIGGTFLADGGVNKIVNTFLGSYWTNKDYGSSTLRDSYRYVLTYDSASDIYFVGGDQRENGCFIRCVRRA